MDLIFMLTREDRTVADCLRVLDEVAPLGLRHIGFKDVGVDFGTLRQLSQRIHELGATCHMELVGLEPRACLAAARAAVEIGVDRLLGGTQVEAVLEVLAGSPVAYYPFAGRPEGHPTRLGGDAALVADHCRRFVERGCAGVDLLAYRATEADPRALMAAARKALGGAQLVVAGSIDSPARLLEVAAAGADAFTVGSSVFEGAWAPARGDIAAQVRGVLAALEAAGAPAAKEA